MKPNEVSEQNSETVFKNLYGFDSYRDYLRAQQGLKPKLNVGVKVRKAYPSGRFDRGYFPHFTDTIHEVKNVAKNNPKPTYKLDNDTRNYYADELQQVDDNPLYRIKKVIKERTVDGRKQLLVEFIGYDGREWIDSGNVEAV